jgi:hypothetical protein
MHVGSIARLCAMIAVSPFIGCAGGDDPPAPPPPSCTSSCAAASLTRCSGAEVETCTTQADGCLAWSAPAPCASPQTCDAGLSACARSVTLSWAANRESAVNRTGGGYEVQVAGRPPVLVPFVSGPTSPTSVSVRLPSGAHTVSLRAFAALDAQGGSSRTYGASQSIVVAVP